MLSPELRTCAQQLSALALTHGLDCPPIEFELAPRNVMLEVAVYGMPVRMRHWSFGIRYAQQLLQQQMGLSHIFEVMFPGDPCRAFLLDSNTLADNTLVLAHVIGHADFITNNCLFRRQLAQGGGDILAQSAARAHQVDALAQQHGHARVDAVLDAALALERHIDADAAPDRQGSPMRPEHDLLWFIARHAPAMQEWEREIFLAVRAEAQYFYPVHACQIMNEGWACYWHARLLREADFLPPQRYLDALRAHSDVVRPHAGAGQSALAINPYHLGFCLWEYLIAQRGMAAARAICREEDDFGFIRNYLDPALAQCLNLFVFQMQTDGEARVASRDIHAVREAILAPRYHYGVPCIAVKQLREDGALVLEHEHRCDGRGLDQKRAQGVLDYIATVWRRPVLLDTVDFRGIARRLEAQPRGPAQT
ncbi:SpoVR family protein [Oxalobacteraceae bacterium]|nr:SpoVR family protein [Oxalobacteraceae bacterium]